MARPAELTRPDFTRIVEEAVELLDVLCRQPSVSAEGQALEETADLVEELLAETGFQTRQLHAAEGPPAVYGEQRGRSDYTLLLYNHYESGAHAPNESVRLEDVGHAVRFMHALLEGLGGPPVAR